MKFCNKKENKYMKPVYPTRTELISANLEKSNTNEYILHLRYRVKSQYGTVIYDIPKVLLPIGSCTERLHENGNVYLKFFDGTKLRLGLNKEGVAIHMVSEKPSKKMTIAEIEKELGYSIEIVLKEEN